MITWPRLPWTITKAMGVYSSKLHTVGVKFSPKKMEKFE